LPELRASDAEREAAVDTLRQAATDGRLDVEELEERLACAYAARTLRELAGLVADVSFDADAAGLGIASARSEKRPVVREEPGGDRWVLSIMGGDDRRGRWRIAEHCNVIDVMGGSTLDLNDAELSAQVTHLNVYSLMDGSDIRVPDGVDVRVSKFALMGGNEVRLGDAVPPPGAPQIRIRLMSIMGGSSVRRGRRPTKADRRRERELRKAKRRGELGP
jgi:hypothetical protein